MSCYIPRKYVLEHLYRCLTLEYGGHGLTVDGQIPFNGPAKRNRTTAKRPLCPAGSVHKHAPTMEVVRCGRR
jgi:hypothetical protein